MKDRNEAQVVREPLVEAKNPRHQEDQAPERVDDTGNRGHQVEDRDHRTAQSGWRVLGDEHRDGNAYWNGDHERDGGDLGRAWQQRGNAELTAGLGEETAGGEEAETG